MATRRRTAAAGIDAAAQDGSPPRRRPGNLPAMPGCARPRGVPRMTLAGLAGEVA